MKKLFTMLVLFVVLHSPLTTGPATSDSKLKRAACKKAYKATEYAKAKQRVYQSTDKYKTKQKAYNATKECKAKRKAYQATDKYKDYQKAYRAKRKIEQEEKIAMALVSLGSNEDLKKKKKQHSLYRKK